MTTLRVRHLTRYRYGAPVEFGVHRLMLRPRDGHDMRILESTLTLSPPADVRWEFDTFGNSVAFATFHAPGTELLLDSQLLLRRYVYDVPVHSLAPRAVVYPFAYGEEDLIDLGPLMLLQHPEERDAVAGWFQRVLPAIPGHSLELLQALSEAIHGSLAYQQREVEGVQTPAETLARGSGSCRDFAFLFMEATRQLGFAARFVTGYLYDPSMDHREPAGAPLSGGGATHAWADIFVPGAGWVEFDPTNRIVAGRNLIRVATTRTPAQASPVRGSFKGGAFLGLDVDVEVHEVPPDEGLGGTAGPGDKRAA